MKKEEGIKIEKYYKEVNSITNKTSISQEYLLRYLGQGHLLSRMQYVPALCLLLNKFSTNSEKDADCVIMLQNNKSQVYKGNMAE